MRGSAFAISQCTRFRGAPGDGNCTNSEFHVSDITVKNLIGTTKSRNVASLQCSAVRPCDKISLLDIDLAYDNGTRSGAIFVVMSTRPKDLHAQELRARVGVRLGNVAIDRRSTHFTQRRG